MILKTATTGLFVLAIMATISPEASAQPLGLLQSDNKLNVLTHKSGVMTKLEESKLAVNVPVALPEPPVKKHAVAENESLNKIAEQHGTTWKRLFDKNESIENPDHITVGNELVIPRPDEALKERPVPLPPAPEPMVAAPASGSGVATQRRSQPATRAVQSRGSSPGNTYSPGYCTWYTKNMRPDLPNNLGNADTWVARARAQGIPTGTAPRAGAIGQQGMHVVYVQSVNGDGTVTISEMNYNGLYVISSRTVPAGTFQYIY